MVGLFLTVLCDEHIRKNKNRNNPAAFSVSCRFDLQDESLQGIHIFGVASSLIKVATGILSEVFLIFTEIPVLCYIVGDRSQYHNQNEKHC